MFLFQGTATQPNGLNWCLEEKDREEFVRTKIIKRVIKERK